MRIADTMPPRRVSSRTKQIAPARSAKGFAGRIAANGNHGGGQKGGEEFPQSHWQRCDAGYVAQFIHQELLPDGLNLPVLCEAIKGYEQANQNLQPKTPFHAKIAV